MMPVDATRTCSGRQPSSAAARSAVRRAFARPSAPVAALALPELITMARMSSAREQLPAPLHRRGADPVGRERSGRRTRPVGRKHRQVEPARRLDPRLDPRRAEAARDEQVSRCHSCESTP